MTPADILGPPTDFAAHAEAVVGRVRSALADVITGLPGFTYRRPSDLAVALDLDPKLAWQLGRCYEGGDAFTSARFIPGPTGMRTFLQAARKHAAPGSALAATQEAFDAFRKLVRTHAGSRKYFNMLAAGLATTDRIRAAVEHRRLMYEGNSYFWGVQARTIFRTNIAYPSARAGWWDFVTLRGFVDFCRTRPNVAWRITRPFSVDSTHQIHTEVPRAALDPRTADAPVPLLVEFCTQPVPQFRPVPGAFGDQEFEFIESSVGHTARTTCVTGEVLRHVEPRYRAPGYDDLCTAFPVRTPAEVLIFDLLIHRDAWSPATPPADPSFDVRADLYNDLFGGGPAMRYEPTDRLPLHEPVVRLEGGLDQAHTPDVPRYAELLRDALARVGWSSAAFNHYRLRIQYPPLPTTVMLRRGLPERPAVEAAHAAD